MISWARPNTNIFVVVFQFDDQNREVEGSIDDIVSMLKWSGLRWDEGPGSSFSEQNQLAGGQDEATQGHKVHGAKGPYYQS